MGQLRKQLHFEDDLHEAVFREDSYTHRPAREVEIGDADSHRHQEYEYEYLESNNLA